MARGLMEMGAAMTDWLGPVLLPVRLRHVDVQE